MGVYTNVYPEGILMRRAAKLRLKNDVKPKKRFTTDHEIALVATLALDIHGDSRGIKDAIRNLRTSYRDREDYPTIHEHFESWLGHRDIVELTKEKCTQLGDSPGGHYGVKNTRLQ